MTNGDFVRNMSDKELAELIVSEKIEGRYCFDFEKDALFYKILEWLKKEKYK